MQESGKIDAGSLDIWTASLDQLPAEISDLARVLSMDEVARADRFRFERDRQRFIAARGALRALLGRYLDHDPAKLQFNYGPHGKPAMAQAGRERALFFNVSHSEGRALYAVTEVGEVGVDLEYMRGDLGVEDIAERYFTAAEAASLLRVNGAERTARFFTYWTRKEAYCKAVGVGLSFDPRRIDAAEPADARFQPFELRIDGAVDPAYSVRDLPSGHDFAAAVAVSGSYSTITIRELKLR